MYTKAIDELTCDGFTQKEANQALIMSIAEDTSSSNFTPSYVNIITQLSNQT